MTSSVRKSFALVVPVLVGALVWAPLTWAGNGASWSSGDQFTIVLGDGVSRDLQINGVVEGEKVLFTIVDNLTGASRDVETSVAAFELADVRAQKVDGANIEVSFTVPGSLRGEDAYWLGGMVESDSGKLSGLLLGPGGLSEPLTVEAGHGSLKCGGVCAAVIIISTVSAGIAGCHAGATSCVQSWRDACQLDGGIAYVHPGVCGVLCDGACNGNGGNG